MKLGGAIAALALAVPGVALAASANLSASLSGEGDGSGWFAAEIDAGSGDVCYTLSVDGLDNVVAAHVHAGVEGTDGAPVFAVEVTGEEDDLCIAVEPDTLKAIVAAPGDYYVNVHTAEQPNGAIRGQLAKE
jgi:hypothetical protein